ncbi:hypothetical protein [Methylobacterium sp. Leaf112]|uniref:hypothetical protein n=1 Tax=Methylobacterium sp. Leaf112 TaxID=1736258 RepID=UPI0006FCC242|nr:hypothetical protein [Methylobacterium sp. Leaf112]KQP67304.1 hypothetical protein ASF52_19680 [Methylobacterium sp. Leaf112]
MKALFGFGNALVACEQKLAQGFEHIQQVIDREYGAGMGDRVSRDIGRTQTRDLSGGIKRSDLGLIGRTADRLTQNMLNAALTDRNIGGLQGHRPDYDKMPAFFDAHFAVATDPKFRGSTLRNRTSRFTGARSPGTC